MMNNQLTCELNGIKYLAFEEIIIESNADKIERKIKKYNAINQGVIKVHSGILTTSYIIVRVLVPEDKVMDWANDEG